MLTATAIPSLVGKWSRMRGSGTAKNVICAVALLGPHVAILENHKSGTVEIAIGVRDRGLRRFVPYRDPASRAAVQHSREASPQRLQNSLRRVSEVRVEKCVVHN